MNENKLLSAIKAEIISDYPSSEIIFYGSRSKGHQTDDSDWDILVIIDEDLTEKRKIDIHNKLFEIELESGEIIHSLIHTKQEWQNPLMQVTPFYQQIVKEGISI